MINRIESGLLGYTFWLDFDGELISAPTYKLGGHDWDCELPVCDWDMIDDEWLGYPPCYNAKEQVEGIRQALLTLEKIEGTDENEIDRRERLAQRQSEGRSY